jgi:hypothetical protein
LAFGLGLQTTLGFGAAHGQFEAVVVVPFWFVTAVAALTAALSASPWIPNYAYRFSLRTMLFATALVAVVLGLVGYAVR